MSSDYTVPNNSVFLHSILIIAEKDHLEYYKKVLFWHVPFV